MEDIYVSFPIQNIDYHTLLQQRNLLVEMAVLCPETSRREALETAVACIEQLLVYYKYGTNFPEI